MKLGTDLDLPWNGGPWLDTMFFHTQFAVGVNGLDGQEIPGLAKIAAMPDAELFSRINGGMTGAPPGEIVSMSVTITDTPPAVIHAPATIALLPLAPGGLVVTGRRRSAQS